VLVGVSVEVDVLTGDCVGVLVWEDAIPVFVGVGVMLTVPLETTIFTKTESPKNVPTAF
jgi:hypothetical protein